MGKQGHTEHARLGALRNLMAACPCRVCAQQLLVTKPPLVQMRKRRGRSKVERRGKEERRCAIGANRQLAHK
jgi:hypothetical protein